MRYKINFKYFRKFKKHADYLIKGIFAGALIAIGGRIIIFVLTIVMNVKLAKVFGKSGLFAVGLIFLSVIFQLILAFGSAEYVKPEEN